MTNFLSNIWLVVLIIGLYFSAFVLSCIGIYLCRNKHHFNVRENFSRFVRAIDRDWLLWLITFTLVPLSALFNPILQVLLLFHTTVRDRRPHFWQLALLAMSVCCVYGIYFAFVRG